MQIQFWTEGEIDDTSFVWRMSCSWQITSTRQTPSLSIQFIYYYLFIKRFSNRFQHLATIKIDVCTGRHANQQTTATLIVRLLVPFSNSVFLIGGPLPMQTAAHLIEPNREEICTWASSIWSCALANRCLCNAVCVWRCTVIAHVRLMNVVHTCDYFASIQAWWRLRTHTRCCFHCLCIGNGQSQIIVVRVCCEPSLLFVLITVVRTQFKALA